MKRKDSDLQESTGRRLPRFRIAFLGTPKCWHTKGLEPKFMFSHPNHDLHLHQHPTLQMGRLENQAYGVASWHNRSRLTM
jgi:hypothetical protein